MSSPITDHLICNRWGQYLKKSLIDMFEMGTFWNQSFGGETLTHTYIAEVLSDMYGDAAPSSATVGLYRRMADKWNNDVRQFRQDVNNKDFSTIDDVLVAMGKKPRHQNNGNRDNPTQIYSPWDTEVLRNLRQLGASNDEIRMIGLEILRQTNVDRCREIARTLNYSWA